MQLPIITLQPGRDRPIKQGHHWIFSGAIDRWPAKLEDGDLAEVQDSEGKYLGYGYFKRNGSLSGQMISFDRTPVKEKIGELIAKATVVREAEFDPEQTNCYRLINGAGDYFPGLIVDRYADVLVLQVSTMGIEKLKPMIVDALVAEFRPRMVYEISDMQGRKQEGLPLVRQVLYGKGNKTVDVIENGVKFRVQLEVAHKTGLYLDQRNMRKLIGERATGQRVLNCFAYTGGFSLYAALHGAAQVTSVDISLEAMQQARENFRLNGLPEDEEKYQFIDADVFKFLREAELDYDIVILDPPAFAKQKKDIPNAVKGYREINRQAIQHMPSGSYLLTCSCSYHVDVETFHKTIFQAAEKSGRQVRIIQQHHLAEDHPINIYHQEADYLKSLLLRID